jgi:hypothetical protein
MKCDSFRGSCNTALEALTLFRHSTAKCLTTTTLYSNDI